MEPTQVPPAQAQGISTDELYRQYGEATIQLKIAQQKVMFLEQQINQVLSQPQAK